ncbi:MAG: alanine--tRNA ligase [Pseudomonadota bacterium]|jgi:alanyl-tRNA synthetase
MQCAQIRDAFLNFFASKGHTIVPSSSLIPGNDPSLLFTNSGMVQFKDVFIGMDKRPYTRATSSQRCVRAGGKHNDLENVGYTARHHTFFEMLGNFSFGDYFKRDAIFYAWEFLTQILKLPPERLWVTVHISDDEAADIWIKEVGIDPTRFSRLDEDNFWRMGDTGPCGPSSEIFFDHGPHVPGGPPGSVDDGLDRYIEVWNLVFMQFEQQKEGGLIPLPKPSVDTGMGLERITAVMQHVHSNYEIDLFQALLNATATATGCTNLEEKSLRVIADHIRSCAFMIMDGVIPSNEGRGYVLRRILRRAIRHGHKLGQSESFFHSLVAPLVAQMGAAYPDLTAQQAQIEKVILAEEEQFAKTLDKGMKILEAQLQQLQGTELPGDLVFKLHDTYGFPVDLTADIARERNLTIDLDGYNRLMEEQKTSGAGNAFNVDYTQLNLKGRTEFNGYEQLASTHAQVTALIKDGAAVEALSAGDEGAVVLNQTPFYANSGGQAGDSGLLLAEGVRFEVTDCRKSGESFLHIGRLVSGQLKTGQALAAEVTADIRLATALNHSATHLLHAALRQVLGDHVSQKGSSVDAEKLRFDFSHFEAVSAEQLKTIENIINQHIRHNSAISTDICDMETAKTRGAMALFGEKYGDSVRVLSMGDGFSVELCGGTHARRTGDIGLIRIVSESGVAAGVRRIEAITGRTALQSFDQTQYLVQQAAALLKTTPDLLLDKLEGLVAQNRQNEKSLTVLKGKLAAASANDWLAEAQTLGGIKVLVKRLETGDGDTLLQLVDQLKNKLGEAIVLLAGVEDGKVTLVVGATKAASAKAKAGDLVKFVAEQLEGKGGGRPDMARGAGIDNGRLPQVLESVTGWLQNQLGI